MSTPLDSSYEAGAAERWIAALAADRREWASGEPCASCGEWIGHLAGTVDRDPCPRIPEGVPLKAVRQNCYRVRNFQPTLAGAIRHMERRA